MMILTSVNTLMNAAFSDISDLNHFIECPVVTIQISHVTSQSDADIILDRALR